MKNIKNNKMLLGIGITFLLLATISMSYAWFSATVKNVEVKDQVVKTGTLELTYTDGTEIKLVNARPGATAKKTITVKNTGSLDTDYNLVWQSLNNEITNDEMVISISCQRLNESGNEEESCEGLDETPIKENVVLEARDITSGYSHVYEVTVTFKELSKDQNYNQGKSFTGVLGVEEYKGVTPVSFLTDSWDTIVTAVKEGNTDAYKLGDTKEVDLGDLGKHTVRIANKSTPTECSTDGFSQTACGFVLEFTNTIGNYAMGEKINIGGWRDSSLRSYLNSNIYNAFPTEVQSAIIDTYVVSGAGSKDNGNFTTTDKIYLISVTEIGTPTQTNSDSAASLTRKLDCYNENKYITKDVQSWTRTAAVSQYYAINANSTNEATLVYGDSSSIGYIPLFRIG